ncbi:RNA polymerase sigma factor [Paracoccus caeni]|uniref:RNA polymerase sigma factor n=1 Tax=Paracoccus caeni TaxID=657651 RepID=A0A934SAZ6_9RHOB|nr:RNA polymerase sigma factor [Paracoccus caeni]MBK4215600.1 RNA polymerase sigma factor [Paracoccus caeni]
MLSLDTATGQMPAEADLIQRAAARDKAAIRLIIQIHNQRLYRLVRAITLNDADAEDVLQEAYLRAFRNLDSFHGDSSLATWLSRIAINTALMRRRAERRQKRRAPDAAAVQADIIPFPSPPTPADPERVMAQRQILNFVERAADALPDPFRLVFMARVIEGLNQAETADMLGLPEATVKTRLHRARRMIRDRVEQQIGPVMLEAFPFAGARCARLTDAVIARLDLGE